MEKDGLYGFLLGLGVGIGIGILFAPKSGQETREILKSKADEGSEFLKQRSTEFRQTAAEWVEKGKEAVTKQKDNIADAMEAGRQAYRDTVNQQPAEDLSGGE